jgi:hypothetical protein
MVASLTARAREKEISHGRMIQWDWPFMAAITWSSY